MADLRIKIQNENDETIRYVEIYEDGSDSEYADEIVDWLLTYDGAREFSVEEESK